MPAPRKTDGLSGDDKRQGALVDSGAPVPTENIELPEGLRRQRQGPTTRMPAGTTRCPAMSPAPASEARASFDGANMKIDGNDVLEIKPDRRANAPLWAAFAALCAVFLLGGIALVGKFGVPGSTGGTSDNQQQVSGAPQPANESTFGSGGTRETTGAGAPVGARPPRQ